MSNLRNLVLVLMALVVTACGGGGGGSNDGDNGGGGNVGTTYTVDLTAVGMTDTRTGLSVDASGLPVGGATVTRN